MGEIQQDLVPKKVRKRQCLKEMTDTIAKIGPWNINKLDLSKKYEFKWDTIDRWYNHLLRNIRPEDVKNLKIMAENTLTKNLEYCEKVRANPEISDRDRLRAAQVANDTTEHLIKFLQEVGRLEKVADKVEHSGQVFNVIMPDWFAKQVQKKEEIKKDEKGTET